MKKLLFEIAVILSFVLCLPKKAYADTAALWWNEYDAYVTNKNGIVCDGVAIEYGTKVSVYEETLIDGKYYAVFSIDGDRKQYNTAGENMTPVDEYFDKAIADGESFELYAAADTKVYSGPGFSYPVSAVIPKGSTVTVYADRNISVSYMYPAVYEGIKGWVFHASANGEETTLAKMYSSERYARIFRNAELYDWETNEKSDITLSAGTVVKIVGYRNVAVKDIFEIPIIELDGKRYFVEGEVGFDGSEEPVNVTIKILDPEHLPVFRGYELSERVVPDVEEETTIEGQIVFFYHENKMTTYYIRISDELFLVYSDENLEDYVLGKDFGDKVESASGFYDYLDFFDEYNEIYNAVGSYIIEEFREGRYNQNIENRTLKWKKAPDDIEEALKYSKNPEKKEEKTEKITQKETETEKPEYIERFVIRSTIVPPSDISTYEALETVISDDVYCYAEENMEKYMGYIEAGKKVTVYYPTDVFYSRGSVYIEGSGWASCEAFGDLFSEMTASSETEETNADAGMVQENATVEIKVRKALNKTIIICFAGALLIAIASATGIVLIHRKNKNKQENNEKTD